jgi:hypothetical protein
MKAKKVNEAKITDILKPKSKQEIEKIIGGPILNPDELADFFSTS